MTNEDKAKAREILREKGWTDVSKTVVGKKMELWQPPDSPSSVPFGLEQAYHMEFGRPEEKKKTKKKKGK